MTARAYGRIEMNAEGPGFVLSEAPAHVMIRLKAVFPALHKASRGPFRFPPDKMTCADLDWFVQRYPMELGDGVVRALEAGVATLKADRAEAGRILSPNWTPPAYAGLRPGQAVRDGQARNVEILQRFEGLLVADRVGAGKTYTAATAMLREGNLPAVVVAPAHLSRQWVEVLHRFTTLTAWEVETTKPYDLPPADVYVFRYSNIGKWVDAFGQFTDQAGLGLVVFDEISELRHGRDTVKGRACLGLAHAARRRLGLDATPLYNWGVEIWTIMQYLRPEVFGERDDFLREFAPSGRLEDPQAVRALLVDAHAMVRAEPVGAIPVKKSIIHVDHDVEQLASAEAWAAEMARKAREGTFNERGQAVRDLDLRMRQLTGVAKARSVAHLARMAMAGGEKVLLAGWHREVYSIWLKELAEFRPRLYTGTETQRQKREAFEAFVRGGCQCLIISLRSGKGLDGLQAASKTVIIGELDWSPATHTQVIGRLAREGQEADEVHAIFPVAADGSDPPMVEMTGLKASEQHGVLDGDAPLDVSARDDGSRVQALVERYLKKQDGRAA